ncbi:hypothetical protein D3C81_198420 [compost metagenome]
MIKIKRKMQNIKFKAKKVTPKHEDIDFIKSNTKLKQMTLMGFIRKGYISYPLTGRRSVRRMLYLIK